MIKIEQLIFPMSTLSEISTKAPKEFDKKETKELSANQFQITELSNNLSNLESNIGIAITLLRDLNIVNNKMRENHKILSKEIQDINLFLEKMDYKPYESNISDLEEKYIPSFTASDANIGGSHTSNLDRLLNYNINIPPEF